MGIEDWSFYGWDDAYNARGAWQNGPLHGFVFVFDRKSGEPIWPIEERPVPQSDLPGEHTSPTQPFPTKPAPFAVQSFTEKDINPFLPKEEQDEMRARLRTSRNEGLFTPPSLQGSIGMPGHNGGANWASSAVDPVKGEFYVVSKNLPVMLRAELSNDEPSARSIVGAVVTPEQAAAAMAKANEGVNRLEGILRAGDRAAGLVVENDL